MKKLYLFVLCLFLFSCHKIKYDGQDFTNYDMYVEYSINHLKSPVVIQSISTKQYDSFHHGSYTVYSIVVKDAENKIKFYDENSDIIDVIAKTHHLGDTIR